MTMPWSMDMEEVSICSGSMSYTFHLRTGVRFSSSFSRNRVPCGSVQPSLRNFKSAAFSNGCAHSAIAMYTCLSSLPHRHWLLLRETHLCVARSSREPVLLQGFGLSASR